MQDIPDGWEVVSRKIKRHWTATIILNVVFAWLVDYPQIVSSVTWTIRQKSTGMLKRVTADSESEAADKIAKGWFDADGS